MRKFLLSLFFSLAFSACTPSSDSGTTETTTTPPKVTGQTGETINQNSATPYDFEQIGSNATINIAADNDVLDFQIIGNNNIVNFGAGVTVKTLKIVGSDNTIITALDSLINITSDSGTGNSLIRQ